MKYNRIMPVIIYILIQVSTVQAMQLTNLFSSIWQSIGKKREGSLIVPDQNNPLMKPDSDINYLFEQENLQKLQKYTEPTSKIITSVNEDQSENSQPIKDYITEKTRRENVSALINQYINANTYTKHKILKNLTTQAFVDIYIHGQNHIDTIATNEQSQHLFTYDDNNNVISVPNQSLYDIKDKRDFIHFSINKYNSNVNSEWYLYHPTRQQRTCTQDSSVCWTNYIKSYYNGWAHSRWQKDEQDKPIIYKNPDTPESSTAYVKQRYTEARQAQQSQSIFSTLWSFICRKNIYNDDVLFWENRVRERNVIEHLQSKNNCTPSEAVAILAAFKEHTVASAVENEIESRNSTMPSNKNNEALHYRIISLGSSEKFKKITEGLQKEITYTELDEIYKSRYKQVKSN